jgi:hypothetical protein
MLGTATPPEPGATLIRSNRAMTVWKLRSGSTLEVPSPGYGMLGKRLKPIKLSEDDDTAMLDELIDALRDAGLIIPDKIRDLDDLAIAIRSNPRRENDDGRDWDEAEFGETPQGLEGVRMGHARRRHNRPDESSTARKQRIEAFDRIAGVSRVPAFTTSANHDDRSDNDSEAEA